MIERCVGCGGKVEASNGPVHNYMQSSPGCFAAFNELLAAEYSSISLKVVHRLTVDTWAVQHPGGDKDRRAIQSVGLHLARLMLQLQSPRPPAETNAVMLDFSGKKAMLQQLTQPASFRVTVSDVVPFAGSPLHAEKVREWAVATWRDWSDQHQYIKNWIAEHSCY